MIGFILSFLGTTQGAVMLLLVILLLCIDISINNTGSFGDPDAGNG